MTNVLMFSSRQSFPHITEEHISPGDEEQVYFPQEIDRRVSEAPRITRIAHSVYADTDLTAPNAHTSAARGMQRSASQHPSPTTRFSFARPQIT